MTVAFDKGGTQGPGIRVLVVAEPELFRTGLASLLGEQSDIEVVAQASSSRMGVQLASELRPDVVLMDLRMPDLDGPEATRAIFAQAPGTRVVALSTKDDVAYAVRAGASVFLGKDAPIDAIAAAVRAAARGPAWLTRGAAEALLGGLRETDALGELGRAQTDHPSPRELEVLRLIARGLDTAETAEVLGISQRTVENHVSSILANPGFPRGLATSGRPKVIETARTLDARELECAAGAGRYEGADDPELAAAIEIISAHGCADELTGERKLGRYGARVGRYLLWSDSQRVVALQTFANERAASMMLELGGLYVSGDTERGPDGVRVGRYVLWYDDDRQKFAALQPYSDQRSASEALMYGLRPGADDG